MICIAHLLNEGITKDAVAVWQGNTICDDCLKKVQEHINSAVEKAKEKESRILTPGGVR